MLKTEFITCGKRVAQTSVDGHPLPTFCVRERYHKDDCVDAYGKKRDDQKK